MALTWDPINGELGEIQPFIDFGFSIDKSVILVTDTVHRPPKYNPDIIVRPLETDQDWDGFSDIQFDPDWKYGDDDSQRTWR